MKKQRYTCLVALSLAMMVCLPATSLLAQSSGTVKAAIPFDFMVGNQQLPAGEYTIDSQASPSALIIRDAQHHGRAMALAGATESLKASDQSKLVFSQYGNQYFLSQVWRVGENRGHQLFPSRAEREIAQLTPAPQKKTLVASLK